MQAIILAAGMGKRLGRLTTENTKCMVKVNGTMLIERMMNQLSSIGLDRIIMVIGYQGSKLKNCVGDKINNVPIEYVENTIYNVTNNIYSLYLAKKYLLENDTILLESDIIFESSILNKLLTDPYPNLAVVSKYQSWMDGTVALLDNENYITSFVHRKNFNFRDTDLYYKTVNIYKFSKTFSRSYYVPFLEAYSKALGNNEYYEQVLRVIALLDKPTIKAIRLNGESWYEIDDIHDLNNAETIFANDDYKLKAYQNHYGGYWRYPAITDFCYLVNPFFPPLKLLEEIQSNFNQLMREYPSSLKMNCLLAANHFSINQTSIVVGNGSAEIINAYCSNNSLTTGIIIPTFEEYKNRLNESRIVYYTPCNPGFSYTVNDLMGWFSKSNIQQLILINPDNPSGNLIPKSEVLMLLHWTKSNNIRLILDESFIDFTEKGYRNSLLDDKILEDYPNLIIIKSISKSHGVPGLRLGIAACGDESVIESIKQRLSIWNINSFAEFYLQIVGKYEGEFHHAGMLFKKERASFFQQLRTIQFLRVIPSQANYFLCEVKEGNSFHLTNTLLTKYNLLVKDCSDKAGFKGRYYVRIAVKSKEDNEKMIKALQDIAIMYSKIGQAANV